MHVAKIILTYYLPSEEKKMLTNTAVIAIFVRSISFKIRYKTDRRAAPALCWQVATLNRGVYKQQNFVYINKKMLV